MFCVMNKFSNLIKVRINVLLCAHANVIEIGRTTYRSAIRNILLIYDWNYKSTKTF